LGVTRGGPHRRERVCKDESVMAKHLGGRQRLRTRVALQVVIIVIACLALGAPVLHEAVAQSGAAPTGSGLGSRHWGTRRVPFVLSMGDNVDGSWKQYVRRAISQWSEADEVDMVLVDGGTTGRTCRPTNGRVEVCNADYGDTGWLGLTRLYYDGDHFTKVTVQFNDYYFNQSGGQYNTRKARVHTACHELGHSLGLPHPPNSSGSCVNDSLDLLEETLTPVRANFEDIADLYDHRDRQQTVNRSRGASAADTSFFAPETLAGTQADGDVQHGVIDTPAGDGSGVLSYVTWVNQP